MSFLNIKNVSSEKEINLAMSIYVIPTSDEINLYSPENNKIYQANKIDIILNISSDVKISKVYLLDNNKTSILFTNCNNYKKKIYFNEGYHNLKIKILLKNNVILLKEVNFSVDSLPDIYITKHGLLKKASKNEIEEYIRYYNFTIIHKTGSVPDAFCSLRAKKGEAFVNNNYFGSLNKINFWVNYFDSQGFAWVTSQKKNKILGYNFNNAALINDSKEELWSSIKNKKKLGEALLEFDKTNKTLNFFYQNLSINNMKVTFIKGCSYKSKTIYYLQKQGDLKRSNKEIKNILEENPILVNKYLYVKNHI